MSDDKVDACPLSVLKGCRARMLQEQSREDLRLDCLRLALQRQGARDSRELLVIAEEYYDWVIAESGGEADLTAALPVALDCKGLEWKGLDWRQRAMPAVQRDRLSLGAKKAPAEARPQGRPRQTRSRSGK